MKTSPTHQIASLFLAQRITQMFRSMFRPLGVAMAGLVAGSLVLFSQLALAQGETSFIEGGHYTTLSEPQPVSTGDKIEVLELFWYRCPHCNALEAPLHNWIKNGKPDNAEYVPQPAVLNPAWEPEARAFYTLEALGLVDALHSKLYYAIHSERKNLSSPEKFAEWVAENGGNKDDVLSTYDSFAVNTKTNYAKTLADRYQVNAVPSIVVDGRYVTNVTMAGNAHSLFELVNYLVKKAADERS